jgi:hypothetical protein
VRDGDGSSGEQTEQDDARDDGRRSQAPGHRRTLIVLDAVPVAPESSVTVSRSVKEPGLL